MGWLITFWVTPIMIAAHLLFAVGTTLYVLGAIQLEERDLLANFGARYRIYRRSVPMLLPRLPGRDAEEPSSKEARASVMDD